MLFEYRTLDAKEKAFASSMTKIQVGEKNNNTARTTRIGRRRKTEERATVKIQMGKRRQRQGEECNVVYCWWMMESE
jgi:hypothetical protein